MKPVAFQKKSGAGIVVDADEVVALEQFPGGYDFGERVLITLRCGLAIEVSGKILDVLLKVSEAASTK